MNKKYIGEKLKIGLGTVQACLKKLFGTEIYERHYNATISDKVERFLRTQAQIIKTGIKDPPYIVPKIEQIIETCKIVTGESVSHPTVHDRFQKLLGRKLYTKVYPKIIVPVNALVETFFENKAREIQDSGDKTQSLNEIAEECYLTTGFPVGLKIMMAAETKGEHKEKPRDLLGKATADTKTLGQPPKYDKQEAGTQEFPLTGRVGDEWFLQLLNKPMGRGE